jgi:hypothetical protein
MPIKCHLRTNPRSPKLKLKRTFLLVLLLALFLAFISMNALAKPTLTLDFQRNNGYGMGNNLNGDWTINTNVSQNVTRVEFYLDNWLEANDSVAPFSWSFNTGDYSTGPHTIKVVAFDSAGETAVEEMPEDFIEYPLGYVSGIIILALSITVALFLVGLYKYKKKQQK